jgi:hypothetical protein
MLTASQKSAFLYAESVAKKQNEKAYLKLKEIWNEHVPNEISLPRFLEGLELNSEVCIHFHPDRIGNNGKSVLESLTESGYYANQFETGISNGGLDKLIDGKRQLWESRLFGNSYSNDSENLGERPKYGALDVMRNPDGPSPRFGSCYFRLQPKVNVRCTFTYLDSYFEPESIGTISFLSSVLLEMAMELIKKNALFGVENIDLEHFVKRIGIENTQSKKAGRALDEYVEAQIHGEISLKEDVNELVADACFRDTEVEKELEVLCKKFDISLSWQAGFSITPQLIPTDFRGENMQKLAREITESGDLTAYEIGLASKNALQNPTSWEKWGTPIEIQQKLKYLWHALMLFGEYKL